MVILRLVFLVFLLAPPLRATTCPVSQTQATSYFIEIGLSAVSLLPSGLPDLGLSIPAYGPLIGVPIFGDFIELQARYGVNQGLSVMHAELDYRFLIPLPLFTFFLTGGVDFLRYNFEVKDVGTRNHQSFSPMLGAGFQFQVTGSVQALLFHKVYFHEFPLVTQGAGFSYLW